MRASRSVVQYLCHNSRRQISGSKLLLHLALCIDEDSPPRSGHLRPSSSSQDQQTHEFREDRETHVCQAAPRAEESDKASQSSGKVNLSSACPWSRRLHSRVDRDKQRLQTKNFVAKAWFALWESPEPPHNDAHADTQAAYRRLAETATKT